MSTTEAEYYAASFCCQEICWVTECLKETGFEYKLLRDYLKMLKSDALTFSADTIRTYLKDLFDRKAVEVRQNPASITSKSSVTIAIWSGSRSQDFLGFTIHYIDDDDWNLKNFLLDFEPMPEGHSGLAIYSSVTKIMDFWGLEGKIASFTMDNASANHEFIEHLSFHSPGFNWSCQVRCAAHIAFNESLLLLESKIVKIQKIVPSCASAKRIAKFHEFCESRRQKARTQICDCDTRWEWNSTLDMITFAISP